ncbi:MAG: hypothetical protein MUF58_06905 [Arcicella sp.]|jgi:hypothetical protein|nr:hypothetical protein [Arcicella sp.]
MEKLFIICEISSVVLMCICIIFYLDELRRYYRRYIGILSIYLSLLSISLLFIAFLYGFHSDVFSIHDRSLSQQNSYNWFNLKDVYKFPIDQLRLNKERTPFANSPISYNSQNEDALAHLILFDVTRSCKETDLYKNVFKISKQESNGIIQTQCFTFEEGLDHFGQLLFIKTIDKTFQLPNGSYVCTGLYNGQSKCKMFENGFTVIDKTKTCEFIEQRGLETSKILSQKAEKQVTDYCQLVSDIKNRLLSEPQLKKTKGVKTVLTIVGDFYNDNTDFEILGDSLLKLRNSLKISQINLIIIPNGMQNSEGNVQKTIDKFKLNFGDILNFTELKAIDLVGERLELFDSITSFTQVSEKSSIVLYNPYSVFNRDEKAVGRITFDSLEAGQNVYLCLKSDNIYSEAPYSCLFNGKKVFYDRPFTEKNLITNTLEISGLNSERHNLYLEYHKPNSNFKLKVPIVIRERLSETSSLSLIFFYSILYTCAFIIGVTFFLITKRVAGKRNRQGRWMKKGIELIGVTAITITGLLALFLIYSVTIVQGIYNLAPDNFWGMIACCCPIIFLWILFFRYGKVKLLLKYIFK